MAKETDKTRSAKRAETKPLRGIQLNRLAKISGIARKKLADLTIEEISDKYRFKLDLTLLFFRKVCGQVVKRDPETGKLHPVPFATVHVEDTDCNLLTYAPHKSPYIWFYPILCAREEIATTVTDECGRFCVYVPRWDIDWILKWRKSRICFPDIFVRPRIRDILDDILQRIPDPFPPERIPGPFPPRPQPDPLPMRLRDSGLALDRAQAMLGSDVVEQIVLLSESATFGESSNELQGILDREAASKSIPPPFSDKLRAGIQLEGKTGDFARLNDEMLSTIAADLSAKPEVLSDLKKVRMDRYIGPFRRCFDIYFPEWSTIIDVPDITFRVTQDVDGDGDEETIYSESYFDVRWDSGDIPDVTLEASEIAISVDTCHTPDPEDIPCKDPAIVMAGLMPLHNPPADPIPYHDLATGYAKRPNRPHPSGGFSTPALPSPPPSHLLASAPFTRTLQLYGCNKYDGAKYYRLRYTFNGSSPQTFTGHSWKVVRWVGSPGHLESKTVAADTNGWYEILPVTDEWLPSHLLLSWPTKNFQNGLYDIYMELGDNSKSVVHTTGQVGIRLDNTWVYNNDVGAVAHFTVLKWRHVGEGEDDWKSLLVTCPVVRRDKGKDVEFAVGIEVATPHLRSIMLWGSGCGSTHPELSGSLPANWEALWGSRGMRHWHMSALDNSFNNTLNPVLYRLAATANSGVYTFSLNAHSRAFSPAGNDSGFNLDWHYNPVYNWRHPRLHIAVVDK